MLSDWLVDTKCIFSILTTGPLLCLLHLLLSGAIAILVDFPGTPPSHSPSSVLAGSFCSAFNSIEILSVL